MGTIDSGTRKMSRTTFTKKRAGEREREEENVRKKNCKSVKNEWEKLVADSAAAAVAVAGSVNDGTRINGGSVVVRHST